MTQSIVEVAPPVSALVAAYETSKRRNVESLLHEALPPRHDSD